MEIRRFPIQKARRIPKAVEDGCKLIFKRRKDGTVIKEIKGRCSREQLDALAGNEIIGEQKDD